MQSFSYQLWAWLVVLVCVPTHFFIALFCIFTPNFMKNHRKLARLFIKIIAKSMKLNVIVDGLEHIPTDKPCIFMANHSSLIDILVMVIGIPCHFNFIAKKELFWVPFIGLDMVFGGDFLIDRHSPRKAKKCLKKVENRLKKGWNMLIFPEGTRSTTGELLPFKRGAFKLAVETDAYIIPCYINGSDKIVQKNSLKPTPGNVYIYFSHPIIPKQDSTQKTSTKNLTSETFDEIQTLKNVHQKKNLVHQ